jgi:hypothetical protein
LIEKSRQRSIRSALTAGMLYFDAGHHAALRVRRCAGMPVGDSRLSNHSFNRDRDHNTRLPMRTNGQNSLRLTRRLMDFVDKWSSTATSSMSR